MDYTPPIPPPLPPPLVLTGREFVGPLDFNPDVVAAARDAALLIGDAETIVVLMGAGMGVDSGLGTFRGKNAAVFAPLKERGIDFAIMSTPVMFEKDLALAWGFWSWRYDAYVRKSSPHEGYHLLKKWCDSKTDHFVFTSNIDGHTPKVFSNVVECHGSCLYWQCAHNCTSEIWSDELRVEIDPESLLAVPPLPLCKNCGVAPMRPNVCMFDDCSWNQSRTNLQHDDYEAWLLKLRQRSGTLVVIEVGAGSSVPSVRLATQRLCRDFGGKLVRINLEESFAEGHISMPLGALKALQMIDEQLMKGA